MFIIKWFILQFKILKNSFKENKSRYFFRTLMHESIFIFGFGILYFFLIRMFDFASYRQMQPFDFAATLFSFSTLLFLPLLVYSAIICALSFFFQKEEISFFFNLPVKRTQVFSVKFWQTYLESTWMAFLGILTFIVAMQTYFGLGFWVYLGGLLATLAYLLIPICLGVIVTVLLSRFFAFIRAKEILIVIGLFVGSIIGLIFRMLQPERLINPEGKLRLLTFVQNIHSPWMTSLPSEWLTGVLVAYYQRDWSGILLNISILLVVALFLLLMVYILAQRFYLSIWTDSLTVPAASLKKFRWQALLKIFPEHLRTLVKKDLLSFYRDTVERGSLLVFIPLVALYFYSMYMLVRYIHNYGESWFSFLYQYLFNLFYAGLVICGLAGRWVFPSITAEGSNFRLLRMSILPLKELVRAKFWLGFLPLFVLAEILAVGSCWIMQTPFFFAVVAFLLMLMLTLGIVLIALILGIRMADFSVKEPMDFALSYQGFVFLIFAFLFMGSMIILSGIPIALYLERGWGILAFIGMVVALLGMGVIFYYGLYLPYRRAVALLAQRDVNTG